MDDIFEDAESELDDFITAIEAARNAQERAEEIEEKINDCFSTFQDDSDADTRQAAHDEVIDLVQELERINDTVQRSDWRSLLADILDNVESADNLLGSLEQDAKGDDEAGVLLEERAAKLEVIADQAESFGSEFETIQETVDLATDRMTRTLTAIEEEQAYQRDEEEEEVCFAPLTSPTPSLY